MKTPSLLLVSACSLAAAEYLVLDVTRRGPQPYSRLMRRQGFVADLTQNTNKLEYLVNITVGTPPQNLAVTLDTGSSDLWIPAVSSRPCQQGKCDAGAFDPQSSSSYNVIDAGEFNITYAAAGDSDAGDWVEETVTVGSSKAIDNVILGVALDGFDPHGVMGVGFDTNEAQPNPGSRNGVYSSVLDHMVNQSLINRAAYGLYLNDLNETAGSLCFGCVDSTKYTGDLVALPLQASPPTEEGEDGTVREFMVTLTSVVFTDASGATTVLTPDGYAQAALLDSGTSATLLSNDVFEPLAAGMGAVGVDEVPDQYYVPCSYSSTNATLTYTFGGEGGPAVIVPFSEMIGSQSFTPDQFNAPSGGCDLGIGAPMQGSVVLGDTFLRNAYAVFDITNEQVAIAQGAGNKQGTSSVQAIPTGTDIPGVSSTATATGTQLSGSAVTETANVPTASKSDGKYLTATPTFNLGASATSSGAHASGTSNAAIATKAPQAALLGAGLMAGALLL